MPEDLCYDLLDDIDFHYNKVKCRKIEKMLPQLNRMVDMEEKSMTGIGKTGYSACDETGPRPCVSGH